MVLFKLQPNEQIGPIRFEGKVIIQAFQELSPSEGFHPIDDFHYQPVVFFIKKNFEKDDEINFFEIYR